MHFIEKYKSSYRTYFKHYQQNTIQLSKGHIGQLVLAFAWMISISVLIGIITQNIDSFLYVYFSITAILIIISLLYTYFTSGYNKQTSKTIYLIPWLKWLSMFLWYQAIISQNIYVELIPTSIILMCTVYVFMTLSLFYVTEKKLGIQSKFISKTIYSALLLYLGHNVFLYMIPVKHITLSYVLILMSMGATLMLKYVLSKLDMRYFKFLKSKGFVIGYTILIMSLYLGLLTRPDIHQKYGFALFDHETIFKYEVHIAKQRKWFHEPILQTITTDDYIYINTNYNTYMFDHDLTPHGHFDNQGMQLIETSLGVMLIEYHFQQDMRLEDRYHFTLYRFDTLGALTHYMSNYVVKQDLIYYIYFDEEGIYYLLPSHPSGFSGYITYYNGTNFNVVEDEFINDLNLNNIYIQDDDIIIGSNDSGLFGVHKRYGRYQFGYQILEDKTAQVSVYETYINDYPFYPYAYGHQHVIYRTVHGPGYLYHSTSESSISDVSLSTFLVSNKVFMQSDGSLYIVDRFSVSYYDDSFNLVSKHSIDGINVENVYDIQFTEDFMVYIIDQTIYITELSNIGSYNIIIQESTNRWFGLLGFVFMFIIWNKYTIRPDKY
jgi:hypothetical protein